MTRTVLCFGDSLTWGLNPETRDRFAYEVRWTGNLAERLGSGYRVIEEGLNARTTGFDDPVEWDRNGRRHFPSILQTHSPVDLVVILLGANDLKPRLGLSAPDIANSASKLVDMARTIGYSSSPEDPSSRRPPHVLLVSPPPLGHLSGTALIFKGAEETSRALATAYSHAAASRGCHFLDSGAHLTPSTTDGIHWDAEANATFAEVLTQYVRDIFAN